MVTIINNFNKMEEENVLSVSEWIDGNGCDFIMANGREISLANDEISDLLEMIIKLYNE